MQSVLNNAPDIRLTLDPHGVITNINFANDIASDLAAENSNDWLGERWPDTVSKTDSKKLDQLLDKASQAIISPYQQITQILPSGLTIPVEYMAVRLGDNTGFVAIGRDVRIVANLQSRLSTIQKSIERDHWKLKEVESHYQKLFESSNDAMMIVDCENYNISEANPAAIIALALPSEISSWNISQHAVQADQKLLQTTLKRACSTGSSPGVLIHFGEQAVPLLVKASLIEFEKSENILVQVQTVHENTDTATIAKNFTFTNFINRLPEAFVVVCHDGNILDANSVFYDLVNVSSNKQLQDKNLSDFIEHEKDSIIDLLDSNTAVRDISCNVIGLNNTRVCASLSTVHIKDIQRNTIGVSIHVRSISKPSSDQVSLRNLLGSKTDQIGKVTFRNLVSSSVELVEKHYIESALAMTNGNRTAAAKMLGLSRQSLYVKLARFNEEK